MSSTYQPTRAVLDEAKTRFLRLFCDFYNPQIVDLAEGGNSAAINLLVFSERKELQTPAPSELTVQDYWTAMRDLETTVETAFAASDSGEALE